MVKALFETSAGAPNTALVVAAPLIRSPAGFDTMALDDRKLASVMAVFEEKP